MPVALDAGRVIGFDLVNESILDRRHRPEFSQLTIDEIRSADLVLTPISRGEVNESVGVWSRQFARVRCDWRLPPRPTQDVERFGIDLAPGAVSHSAFNESGLRAEPLKDLGVRESWIAFALQAKLAR